MSPNTSKSGIWPDWCLCRELQGISEAGPLGKVVIMGNGCSRWGFHRTGVWLALSSWDGKLCGLCTHGFSQLGLHCFEKRVRFWSWPYGNMGTAFQGMWLQLPGLLKEGWCQGEGSCTHAPPKTPWYHQISTYLYVRVCPPDSDIKLCQ